MVHKQFFSEAEVAALPKIVKEQFWCMTGEKSLRLTSDLQKKIILDMFCDKVEKKKKLPRLENEVEATKDGLRKCGVGLEGSMRLKAAQTLANKYPYFFSLEISEYTMERLNRGETVRVFSYELVFLRDEIMLDIKTQEEAIEFYRASCKRLYGNKYDEKTFKKALGRTRTWCKNAYGRPDLVAIYNESGRCAVGIRYHEVLEGNENTFNREMDRQYRQDRALNRKK